MSAIITFIPSLVLPSLFQIILSGSQVVMLPIIEVITSVIYMALTAMGCGGVGVGGGALGAIGGGGICTVIMGYVAMMGTTLGGLLGGLGGFGIRDIIGAMIDVIMGLIMSLPALAAGLL